MSNKEDKFLESLRSFMNEVCEAGQVADGALRGTVDISKGLDRVSTAKRNCRDQMDSLTEKMYKAYKETSRIHEAERFMTKAYGIVNQLKELLYLLDTVQVGQMPEEIRALSELMGAALLEMQKIMAYTVDVKSNFMKIEARSRRIYTIEERGDTCSQECLRFFYGENQNPMYVLYWKDIMHGLEQVLDSAAGMVMPLQKMVG